MGAHRPLICIARTPTWVCAQEGMPSRPRLLWQGVMSSNGFLREREKLLHVKDAPAITAHPS